MSDLLQAAVVAALTIATTLAIRLRMAQLDKRRAERARRRRILRYLHTHHGADASELSNVVSLDTYSRKVQP